MMNLPFISYNIYAVNVIRETDVTFNTIQRKSLRILFDDIVDAQRRLNNGKVEKN